MMPDEINFKQLPHLSEAYWDTVSLRDRILREPLSLKFRKEELLAEGNQMHLAAYINEQLIACLVLKPINSKQIKMRQVAVENAFQKKGIGKKLVRFAEKFALKKNYSMMFCHARDYAIPFYIAQDYQAIGDPFDEIGIEHQKLTKQL